MKAIWYSLWLTIIIMGNSLWSSTLEIDQLGKDKTSLQRTMGLQQIKLRTVISDKENLIKENKELELEVDANKDTAKVLQAIIQCESGFDPKALNKNGTHSMDIGLFQINTRYHQATAKKMGLDIYDTVDNVRYGLYLFDKEGVTPWRASKRCINRIMAKN